MGQNSNGQIQCTRQANGQFKCSRQNKCPDLSMIMCPMYIVDCAPGYQQYKWNSSQGGCNPYPCSNTAPCIPCKDPNNCEGGPFIANKPYPIPSTNIYTTNNITGGGKIYSVDPIPPKINANFSQGLNNDTLQLQKLQTSFNGSANQQEFNQPSVLQSQFTLFQDRSSDPQNVTQGQQIMIKGNENPTTGFTLQYQIVGNGSQGVSLVSRNYTRNQNASPYMMGVGGAAQFVFQVQQNATIGSQFQIQFASYRSWEMTPGQPLANILDQIGFQITG